jgi:hypothetical protein
MSKKVKLTISRSAITGRFVSSQFARSHPKTTMRQIVFVSPKKAAIVSVKKEASGDKKRSQTQPMMPRDIVRQGTSKATSRGGTVGGGAMSAGGKSSKASNADSGRYQRGGGTIGGGAMRKAATKKGAAKKR